MTRKLIALLLAVAMIACCAAAAAEAPYGPTYDEWSEMTDEELIAGGVQPDMMRLSVGIEDAEDIIADIRHALEHLRYPIKKTEKPMRVRCTPFAVFVNDKPFHFKSHMTNELFAYLAYKNGALCPNGELLGLLWDGNLDKSGRLRQLIMDMRLSLEEEGVTNAVIKKYGRTGLNMELVQFEGDVNDILREFNWY